MSLAANARRPFAVIALAALVVLGIRLAWVRFGVPLLINTTASEPMGLYRLRSHNPGAYTRGMLVVFPVPRAFKSLVTERGWLAPGLRLLKAVGAVPGDRVCVTDAGVWVNEVPVGPVFTHDSAGRVLPVYRGCEHVPVGSFWAVSTVIPNSFDSRYMGPQPLASIVGEAVLVWTF